MYGTIISLVWHYITCINDIAVYLVVLMQSKTNYIRECQYLKRILAFN